jgi:arylsulfatase
MTLFSNVTRIVTCLAFIALSTLTAGASPPNIIIVMPDDVGYGDFACHGNPIIKTPAIDRFWRESLRFTDFHVSPTCAPTRAAILTGRHEFKNGVTHTIDERERLTPKATTLAQVLQSAGYATGIFGKWHLGDEPDRWPDKRGFDEMFIHGAGGIGQSYPGSCGDVPGNKYFDPTINHNGRFERSHGYCTDVFFNQATAWIEAIYQQQPFFAFVTPNAAHMPLDVSPKYSSAYDGKVPENVAKFYGMIANIDENFGRMLEHLENLGLTENTLVIFMTDNGTATGSGVYSAGMRGRKNSPYQGGTRVPGLWRWPASFSGEVDCAVLTAHIDILPTLIEVTGAKVSDEVRQQIEGRSLLPLMKDPAAQWPDRTLVTHLGRWPRGEASKSKYAGCSIRDARFTLVNNAELYDLWVDPGEKANVVDAHPDEVAKLRSAYDAWWQSVLPCMENENVTGPRVNPYRELYDQQLAADKASAN